MSIRFTQFLRPNGERRAIEIDRPPEIEKAADALINEGCRFLIEELSTLEISMTCENDNLDEDYQVLAHELCANGPPVLEAVDRLVKTATAVSARVRGRAGVDDSGWIDDSPTGQFYAATEGGESDEQ